MCALKGSVRKRTPNGSVPLRQRTRPTTDRGGKKGPILSYTARRRIRTEQNKAAMAEIILAFKKGLRKISKKARTRREWFINALIKHGYVKSVTDPGRVSALLWRLERTGEITLLLKKKAAKKR